MTASWFWAHDIAPGQVPAVLVPGSRLVRLSAYGQGARRRFAALCRFGGAPRTYAVDVPAAGVAALGRRPVALTVGADGLFGVVLDPEPRPATTIHPDVGQSELAGLGAVLDLAAHPVAGPPRFAAITGGAGGSGIIAGLGPRELAKRLRAERLAPLLLRAYGGGLLAAVTGPDGAGVRWYAGLSADEVARKLDRHHAAPVDLDATGTGDGVRFTVVMRPASQE